jgi:hypothetical protein
MLTLPGPIYIFLSTAFWNIDFVAEWMGLSLNPFDIGAGSTAAYLAANAPFGSKGSRRWSESGSDLFAKNPAADNQMPLPASSKSRI